MPSLPSSLALTNIADGASIIAADHRNNYAAIQTEANGLLTALAVTAKGDLYVATASGAIVNVAVGANGQSLIADSTQASGVKWSSAISGQELAYAELTSATNITTASTEASPLDLISAGAVAFDGATVAVIEVYFPSVAVGASATLGLSLWDTTDQGRLGLWQNNAASVLGYGGVVMRRKVTPSNASHTFKVRGWATVATGSVNPGAGGVGVALPGYIRITKA